MTPQHPDLAATATGEQLDHVRSQFLLLLSEHRVIRGSITTHPTLEGAASATTATVLDCATDDSHTYDAATGAQVEPSGTATHQLRADMTLVDGAWKVAAVHHLSDGCKP